jgi:hypothetical protein
VSRVDSIRVKPARVRKEIERERERDRERGGKDAEGRSTAKIERVSSTHELDFKSCYRTVFMFCYSRKEKEKKKMIPSLRSHIAYRILVPYRTVP